MPLRLLNPNLHVILIHYPLGVFVLGVILELFSFLWRRSSVRGAARWMIVLGALFTLPAATSGIYALYDVRSNQGSNDARYEMLRWHVILMAAASILAVASALIGLGSSNAGRRRLYPLLLLGVVVAWGLMVLGAWHGGETIYQQGTSVAIIKLDDAGKPTLVELPAEKKHDFGVYKTAVNYYLGGILQNHLIMAGVAFAFTLGALGLSFRRASVLRTPVEVVEVAGAAPPINYASAPGRTGSDVAVARSFRPDAEIGPDPDHVPAGRFWLLAALVLVGTAVIGYWRLENLKFFKAEGWQDFVSTIDPKAWPPNREMAHLILGGAMVLLALLMAVFSRVAARNKSLLWTLGGLLVLIIAAQVWMGVLMTFDEGGSSLIKYESWNRSDRVTEPATPGLADSPKVESTAPATAPETAPAPAPETAPATAPAISDLPATLPSPVPTTAPLPPTPAPQTPATLPTAPERPATSAPATEPSIAVPTPPVTPPAAMPDKPLAPIPLPSSPSTTPSTTPSDLPAAPPATSPVNPLLTTAPATAAATQPATSPATQPEAPTAPATPPGADTTKPDPTKPQTPTPDAAPPAGEPSKPADSATPKPDAPPSDSK